MTNIASFSSWLETTSASQWVQATSWVIPAVQSIHIIALAVILASCAMFHVRLIGLAGQTQSLRSAADRFLPTLWYLLPVSLATGAVLILGEPPRELLSPYFWVKMVLLILLVGVTLLVDQLIPDAPLEKSPVLRRNLLRIIGALSLLLLLAIVFCGRWIAYG